MESKDPASDGVYDNELDRVARAIEPRRRYMFAVARGLKGDHRARKENLSDVVQRATYLALSRAVKGIFPGSADSKVIPWLRKCVIDAVVHTRRATVGLVDEAVPAKKTSANTLPLGEEQAKLLRDAVGRLHPDQRKVVRLRFGKTKLTFDEIGARCGFGGPYAHRLFQKAIDQLRSDPRLGSLVDWDGVLTS